MSEQRRYHVGGLPSLLVREARLMLSEGGLKQLNLRRSKKVGEPEVRLVAQ